MASKPRSRRIRARVAASARWGRSSTCCATRPPPRPDPSDKLLPCVSRSAPRIVGAMLTRLLVVVCLAIAGPAWAQTCHLPANSHEARLLAFYEAPLAFSTATGPEQHEPFTVRLGVEVTPLPSPDSS